LSKAFNFRNAKAAGNTENRTNRVCMGKQQPVANETIPENWNTDCDLEMGAKSGKEDKVLKAATSHQFPHLFFQPMVSGNISQVWEELCTKNGIRM
jgi:hypothetical protein